MDRSSKYLPFVYYGLAVVILGIYDLKVSALFSESSHTLTLFVLTGAFVIASGIRMLWESKVVDKLVFQRRGRAQLLFDLALYLMTAVIVITYDVLFETRPLLPVLKLAVGILTIGYFASVDNTLTRQRQWFQEVRDYTSEEFKVWPLAKKLSLFITVTVLLVTTVTWLTTAEDIDLLSFYPSMSTPQIKTIFLLDVVFIFGVILVFCLRLIYSYSLTLQHILDGHVSVLGKVHAGNLDEYIPILTKDEFGLMAIQTNRMIDGLRAEARLRKTLERIVSPNILEKLLTTDDKTLKQGQEYDVAILFCDLREFTSLTESASAEALILFLNQFFSDMVRIVSENSGIVNKFMGDAVLAVYGLESAGNPVEHAVETAWSIIEQAAKTTMPNGRPLELGIGIHTGRVFAGTIGSEDRYEYTFIGDPVNTASRLDGLTKRLEYRVIISSAAYMRLGESTRAKFTDLGAQKLRGKRDPVHAYGAG